MNRTFITTILAVFFILLTVTGAVLVYLVYFTDRFPDYNHIYSDRVKLNSDRRSFSQIISRLEAFEASQTIDYIRVHNSIVFNHSSDRVVFYETWKVGYGNKIYSLLTAFAVAVLSESALLIDWPEIDKYIEPPFNQTFTKFHDNSALDMNRKFPPILKMKPITQNTFNYEKTMLLNVQLPTNVERYYISHWTAYFFDLCMNPDYAERLVKMELVRKETVLKALRSLEDPELVESQKLEYLLQIGFEFSGTVLNKHWRLKPYLRDKISNYIENEFTGSFVIGMQIRFIYLDQSDIRSFIECAKEIESRQREIIGNRTVRWFISTDQRSFLKDIESEYQDKITSGFGKLGHIHTEPDTYERTLMDVEMLARCDETILTGGSTFGFVASMISQKRPYFVEGKRGLEGTCGLFRLSSPARRQEGYGMF